MKWTVLRVACGALLLSGCPPPQRSSSGVPDLGEELVRTFDGGEVWLAAVTTDHACAGLKVATDPSSQAAWGMLLDGQAAEPLAQNNSRTAQRFVLATVWCKKRSPGEGSLRATVTFQGQPRGELSWSLPAGKPEKEDDLVRKLQWEVRLRVYPEGAKDAKPPGKIEAQPRLKEIVPKTGTFLAGEMRLRGVCDGVADRESCYEEHFGTTDRELCQRAPDASDCLSTLRAGTMRWFDPSTPRLVLVMVTTAGAFVSSPYDGGSLGTIDTPDEARILAAMQTGVWEDSRVLEIPGLGYYVFSSPAAMVSPSGSMAMGMSDTCALAPNPEWSNPTLRCKVKTSSSSCNSMPVIEYDCGPRNQVAIDPADATPARD